MNRPARWLASFALVAASTLSAQTLELRERADELTLGDISFPSSEVGTLIFRRCASCDPESVQLGPDTAYLTPRGPMALADLRAYVSEIRSTPDAGDATFVTVFRSMSDDSVTRVEIHGSD